MELDWSQEAAGPVTLVHARLRNDRATDRRVRLRNRLDGPVLPPRRHGVPEAGWDREGATAVVPAGECAALGYACPAPATDPPVVVDEVTAPTEPADERSPKRAIRELGDHRPPRAVLGGEQAGAAADDSESLGGGGAEKANSEPAIDLSPGELPGRLDRSRARIRTAEALTAVGVTEASALVRANGGVQGVESLAADLDADARALRALARTASALADRAAAAAPPIEHLRRLS